MMGRQRAAKYARVTEGTNKDGRPKPAKEAYDEIIYENAAFEEYYQVGVSNTHEQSVMSARLDSCFVCERTPHL